MIRKSIEFLRRFTPLLYLTALIGYGATAVHFAWDLKLAAPLGVLMSIAGLFALERLMPRRKAENGSAAEVARDGFFLGLGAIMDAVGRIAAVTIAVSLAGDRSFLSIPLWLELILGVYIAEFFAYWFHRLSHREGWLWSIHSIHHLPEKVNLTNNFLMHPLNIFFLKLMRSTPLLLLGFSQEAVFLHGLFAVGVAFSVHANVGGPLGFWNYLIGTAELHRMHHSKDPHEAGNHGTVVPLWDQVFGTFRYDRKCEPEAIGVTEREQYPKTIVGMLLHPLKLRSMVGGIAILFALTFGAGCAKNIYTQLEIEPEVFRIVPGRELSWGGGIRGLFFGEHIFLLERVAPGRTKLIQKETFEGIFVPFAELGSIEEGYNLMNHALKQKIEQKLNAQN